MQNNPALPSHVVEDHVKCFLGFLGRVEVGDEGGKRWHISGPLISLLLSLLPLCDG